MVKEIKRIKCWKKWLERWWIIEKSGENWLRKGWKKGLFVAGQENASEHIKTTSFRAEHCSSTRILFRSEPGWRQLHGSRVSASGARRSGAWIGRGSNALWEEAGAGFGRGSWIQLGLGSGFWSWASELMLGFGFFPFLFIFFLFLFKLIHFN